MRVVFFGSPDFAVPSLEAVSARHEVVAVVSQPDRPSGRGQKLVGPPVKAAALRLGMKVLQPAKIRGPELCDALRVLGADAFVVVAYGRILPQQLLDLPRLGAWNVHASVLPALRGAAPIQWAIIRGELRTGVSIMRMEAGLDTGPVAAVTEVAISSDDTAGTLAERLARDGAELLAETLPRIESETVTLVPQDHAHATLAPLLTKQDGRLDFAQSAAAVSARARGVDPWPGATALLQGEPMKVFRPRVVTGLGAPGEVLGAGPDGLVVACGSGAVAFAELQLPGRRRLAADRVLAGRPIPAGTRLG